MEKSFPTQCGLVCFQCKKRLEADEIGIYKKLVSPSVTKFKCLTCLSREVGAGEEVLREQIAYFKKENCPYFL